MTDPFGTYRDFQVAQRGIDRVFEDLWLAHAHEILEAREQDLQQQIDEEGCGAAIAVLIYGPHHDALERIGEELDSAGTGDDLHDLTNGWMP